jgi:D-beta-D-heptose 7-phosphate kinase / D-beta-D-heptose 1-phosphate adenosyltransferase
MSRLVVVGDALLDRDVEGRSERLCPDAPVPVVDQLASRPRPGGAGLAASLAAAAGADVTLVTALAPDQAGVELARGLVEAGVDVVDLGLDGETPEKVRILDCDRPLLRLDRGRGGRVGAAAEPAVLRAAIEAGGGVLVSDYGHGVAAHPLMRRALASRPAGMPLVWDPHPRGPAPIEGASLATPNLSEAKRFAGRAAPRDEDAVAELALELLAAWRVDAVCITRGGDGALLAAADGGVAGYGSEWVDGDPCGAGDRFAAEAAAVLAGGGGVEEAIWSAVAAASGFVAAGGARLAIGGGEPAALRDAGDQGVGASPLSIEPALRLAERVRRRGGTVVASGGCFDLLHVGHLHTLRSARALGDCLIVLLNGDRSVRRLKGDARPLVPELDRAALLASLDCVDEVAIFDEETPVEALRLLRPHVWAKGGDYAVDELPERDAVASWGGRIVVLPHLDGRSTTNLIERVGRHG